MAKTFQCSLVTPQRQELEGEATYANLPAHDGQLGVMADHAPMLVKLGSGPMRLDMAEGSARRFALDGGFAQMRQNKLILITERATEVE